MSSAATSSISPSASPVTSPQAPVPASPAVVVPRDSTAVVVGALFTGALTAAIAGMLTSIHPAGGFLFGVTQSLTADLTGFLRERIQLLPPDGPAKEIATRVGDVLLVATIFAVPAFTTLLCAGFPLSLSSAVILAIPSLWVTFSHTDSYRKTTI